MLRKQRRLGLGLNLDGPVHAEQIRKFRPKYNPCCNECNADDKILKYTTNETHTVAYKLNYFVNPFGRTLALKSTQLLRAGFLKWYRTDANPTGTTFVFDG